MKQRRSAETLIEFLMAVFIFGLMMAGVFEFMANQTNILANIKARDELMFYAQKCIDYYYATGNKLEANEINFTFDNDESPKILTVSRGSYALDFTFKE